MTAYCEFEKARNAIRELFMTIAEELRIPKALDWILNRINPTITIHLSRGLSIFVKDKVKLLCLQPGHRDSSLSARAMWIMHTEDRLKDRIAERLATKGD